MCNCQLQIPPTAINTRQSKGLYCHYPKVGMWEAMYEAEGWKIAFIVLTSSLQHLVRRVGKLYQLQFCLYYINQTCRMTICMHKLCRISVLYIRY
ncbi:hypothetical protein GDO78_007078 [Eleutherodactylus coqui]|uniref:Uncharacterized protein n=1 Tax=Eleutherodactylus coqui TaxID=57060 RepID=A0A8J6KBM2_ELECQ|nr:hypothetical protein GDO78_007078 [Eleutherodactylus coqui]